MDGIRRDVAIAYLTGFNVDGLATGHFDKTSEGLTVMAMQDLHVTWMDAFLFDQIHAKGLAKTSMLTIRLELYAWARWLDSVSVPWDQVTPFTIHSWLEMNVNLKDATLEKKTWVLRSLYRWALDGGLVSADPWVRIVRPSHRRHWTPRFVPSRAALERLFAEPETLTPVGVRDRAILELLYATGLRASELLTLTCQQIALGEPDRVITVMGKGGKERIVIYCQQTHTWLRYYRQIARRHLLADCCSGDPSGKLFLQQVTGAPMTYAVLRRLIRHYADSAGLPLVTAHSLRHAFASHLYEGGADLRVIQMLLGHSCLETTCVYARPSIKQLQEHIEHHHPRGAHYEAQQGVRWHRRYPAEQEAPASGTDSDVSSDSARLVDRWLIKTAT